MSYQEQLSRMSTKDLLKTIIRERSEGGSIENILKDKDVPDLFYDCTYEELTTKYAVSSSRAEVIIAIQEMYRRLNSEYVMKKFKVTSPESVYKLMAPEMKYLKKEHFVVLLLSTKNEVLSKELISIGSLNASIVHPREVFNVAIRKNAAALIICHNHPSYDYPEPSREDINITDRIVEAGKIIGISVLDHIIVSGNKYYSFKENDLI